MARAHPTGNPRVHWQAGLSQAHRHRDSQPGFGCFDFPREILLAGSLNIQAVRFSFRNTSVLNQGFRNGDRGHLLPTRTTSGLWATLVTRTPPGTMLRWDQPSPQQAQTHSCRSCSWLGRLQPVCVWERLELDLGGTVEGPCSGCGGGNGCDPPIPSTKQDLHECV